MVLEASANINASEVSDMPALEQRSRRGSVGGGGGKHERRRSISVERSSEDMIPPLQEVKSDRKSRRRESIQEEGMESPLALKEESGNGEKGERRTSRRASIQEDNPEKHIADFEKEFNAARKEASQRRRNSIQQEGGQQQVPEEKENKESPNSNGSNSNNNTEKRRTKRRESIQAESAIVESSEDDGERRGRRRESISENKGRRSTDRDRSPAKSEMVFKSLAERKAELQAHVLQAAKAEIEEIKRGELPSEAEEIAMEDFKLMIELYSRILFELEIQGAWQELQEKGIVKQEWDTMEAKLYQDPKLYAIADLANPEWAELRMRIFEIRHTLSDLSSIFQSTFSLQVYSHVFSLVEILMTEEVQARCKQGWYNRRYTAWAQQHALVPIIFLMDIKEISVIAEVMFDSMDFNLRQKFVDIIFDNANGNLRAVIQRNLQRRRASVVEKFMDEVGQMKHRAMGFISNTASTLQRALKKDEKEKDPNFTSTATLDVGKAKFARPISREELSKFVYGNEDGPQNLTDHIFGSLNDNTLFRKSVSHMLLSEELNFKRTKEREKNKDKQAVKKEDSNIKKSLTQELLDNPETLNLMDRFDATEKLLRELQDEMGSFLKNPEVQGPEWESTKQKVASNLELFKKLEIPEPPAIKAAPEGSRVETSDSEESDAGEEPSKNKTIENSAEHPKEHDSTHPKNQNAHKNWKNMKSRIKGLLTVRKQNLASEFDSSNELDAMDRGEKLGK